IHVTCSAVHIIRISCPTAMGYPARAWRQEVDEMQSSAPSLAYFRIPQGSLTSEAVWDPRPHLVCRPHLDRGNSQNSTIPPSQCPRGPEWGLRPTHTLLRRHVGTQQIQNRCREGNHTAFPPWETVTTTAE
uniref:Uncharacterized protein n=1 Tax=Chlorocebus sabaeus TaxID=60711 RepID=A0A0D9QYK9_CHLSB